MARCSVLYMQTKTSLPFKKILHTQHRDSLKRDINMITCALHQSSSCIPGNDSQHMNVVWDNKKSILGLWLVNPTPDHKQVSSVTTTGRKGQGLKKGAGGAGKTTEQGDRTSLLSKGSKMKAAVMHVFLLVSRDGLRSETAGLLRSFNRQIGSSMFYLFRD